MDSNREGTVIRSVDVPSGWNIDLGDTMGTGFKPDVLTSLTSPKFCSRSFEGRIYFGGRFIPPRIADKYRIKVKFQGMSSSYCYSTSFPVNSLPVIASVVTPPLVHFEDSPIPWGESNGGNIASFVQHMCCVSFYAFFVVPTFLYKMPPYPGVSQVVEIEKLDDWQVQYAQNFSEKEAKELAV